MQARPHAAFEIVSLAEPSKLSSSSIGRTLWLILAAVSLVLGIIGIVLPVLPTTPFILLAAFAAARGSTRLHAWMRNHARFGPPLRDWERDGAVSRRAKILASAMMSSSAVVMFVFTPHWWIAAGASAVMLAVAIWLWLRPEPRSRAP